MPRRSYLHLSRRERQVMDVLYRDGRSTAARIREQIPEPPSYSAVRALLRVLDAQQSREGSYRAGEFRVDVVPGETAASATVKLQNKAP